MKGSTLMKPNNRARRNSVVSPSIAQDLKVIPLFPDSESRVRPEMRSTIDGLTFGELLEAVIMFNQILDYMYKVVAERRTGVENN